MNAYPLLATGHIEPWLLICGLFFPRLVLFVAWLGNGTYPANPLPDLINFAFWLIFPRFLIAYYIFIDIGMNNLWFWVYLATGLAGMVGEGGYVRHRIVRRTTVSQDGRTTTTVEEEEV